MSDRIKKIKIKQSDGTFSDYIPIGADAKNIDTTRGESVQSVIDKTARYYNSIAEMKLDDNIQVGDTCVTLGYYEVNDGGSGTYKIVDDSSLEDDGGSIHELNNGLKAKLVIENNTVNVTQFGAKGDGIHDDTIQIINAINKNKKIIFPNGIYSISQELTFYDKIYLKLEEGAVLKFTGGLTENFIKIIHNSNIPNNYIRDCYIKGGTIDCNNLVQNAIKIGGMHNIIIEPSHIKNYTNSAIFIDKNIGGNVAGGIMMSNVLCTSEESNYGIYDSGNDDIFTNLIVQNAKTGIYTESGRFIGVHCWIGKSSLIPNSLFAYIGGRICNFIGCFMDTYQNGFDGKNNTALMISNLKIFDLPSFYTDEIFKNYPHTLLFNRTNMEYSINGLYFATSHDFNFANDNNYNNHSKFNNITIHNETGLITVKNWCNQGDILYENTELITGVKPSSAIGTIYNTKTINLEKSGYDVIGVTLYNPQYLSKSMYFITLLGNNAKVSCMSISQDEGEYGFQLRVIYKKQKYF